jgi:hypothetical protein
MGVSDTIRILQRTSLLNNYAFFLHSLNTAVLYSHFFHAVSDEQKHVISS